MSQKAEKPTLSGQRIKTRKRDEKEKHDPNAFRDALLQGLSEAGNDLEKVTVFLEQAGSQKKYNYRRYAEALFDILIAGGLLAPGGTLLDDPDPTKVTRTDICIFAAEDNDEVLRAYYEVFHRLIRRYRYLERVFEDEMKKVLMCMKGYKEEERIKLAKVTALFLANDLTSPKCLQHLTADHLLKDGVGLDFATQVFKTWLQIKNSKDLKQALKQGQVDGKLFELFPSNKRTMEHFEKHFKAHNLDAIVDFQRSYLNAQIKKSVNERLDNMVAEEVPVKEIIAFIRESQTKTNLNDHEFVLLVWQSVMKGIEWNKKEELVAEQALRHLKTYAPVLAELTNTARSEMALIVKVQEYCYDNMNFMKVFQKMILLFYKTSVLSEEVILKWYKDGHSPKGKSVFLEQMKQFVEWLENAEEESDSEDEN